VLAASKDLRMRSQDTFNRPRLVFLAKPILRRVWRRAEQTRNIVPASTDTRVWLPGAVDHDLECGSARGASEAAEAAVETGEGEAGTG
jgi:hypothetical protein